MKTKLHEIPEKTLEAIEDAQAREEKNAGRAFASDREAWAVLRELMDKAEARRKAAENLEKELWEAICDGEEDTARALIEELIRKATENALVWVTISAQARRAAES